MNDLTPQSNEILNLPKGRAGPVFAGNIAVKNLSYAVADKKILNDVSLQVEAGQIACILGPSGCGKTTLLRLLAGILRPRSGQIFLDNTEVSGPEVHVPPERRNIGLMFQDYALFPHMTAIENVAYGLYALKRSEARKVAELALNRVGLGELANQYPSTLSGGEQQRVALARAIVPRPQVVMMDEPFSGLDQRLKESVRDETLSLLKETRATTVLVTHDPDEALAFADRIFLMGKGKILQAGTPDDMLHRPTSAAVAQFFRNYARFSGRVENGLVKTLVGPVTANGIANGTLVDVLVAPAGLKITASGKGADGTIVENRILGSVRRLVVKLEGHNAPVLVHSEVSHRGPCGLVLNGEPPHIFPITNDEI
jgi:iron(III) transport system ATP-binding protein